MKRFTLSLLSFCFTLLVTAEPVGKQAALYTARSYMLAKGKNVNAAQMPFKAARKAADGTAAEEEAYYYVFNAGDDGGYVIVSGDDRTDPILGYVDHGSFDPDNIPENMRSWLQGYADEIKYIIDNDLQPNSPLLRRSYKIQGTKHSIAELLTTRWNQGLPYNLTVEKYYKEDGSLARPATGCIATAWAQVINFHKFPEKTKVQMPAYSKTYTLSDGTKKTVTFPAVPRGSVIDWENMQDTYSCNEDHAHTAADTAVANLMRYCGQAVKMGYGPSSGANWKADDVIKYFGFDDSGYRAGRDQYSIDEWFDLIYKEIEAGYPVPFSGSKISGGHAFVLDGFDGENLFHVNWGWGGSSNGWFLIGVLNSGDNSGIGAASGSGGYARGQAAVIGLRRPDKIAADPKNVLDVSNVTIDGTSIKCTYENNTGTIINFNTGIVKLEDDGTRSLVGSAQLITNMAEDATQNKTFQLSGKLPEGTYKLSPGSKQTSSKIWKSAYNMRDEYIEAIVDADGVPTMRIITPVYNLSIDSIAFLGNRVVGQEQEIEVTFKNNGSEFYKDVYLLASKTQAMINTGNLARVAVRQGETAKFSFYYTPEETGTYNLWLCTKKDGSGLIGQGKMVVIQESEAALASLSITYAISNGANNIAYGKRLIGKAIIKNLKSTDFNGNIKLQMWKQKVTSSSASSGSTSTYSISVPAQGSDTIDFCFENLSDGYYYRFKALYSNQEGNLSGGGLWDYKCEMKEGILSWKGDGTVKGAAHSSTYSTAADACGIYADCSSRISLFRTNNNPNTIYALASEMAVPTSLKKYNAVSGNHADRINLTNDLPYYIPVSFTADSATFVYSFAETEDGSRWHAFTMPFETDSICVDGTPVSLDDNDNKHFWIYEFAAQGDNGEVIFAPALTLRAGTPYIIAADATMAGRSIAFHATNVPFYKTGSDKMTVSTRYYQFRGNTYTPVINDCYVINASGTAFEYIAGNTTLNALTPYFTTILPEGLRLQNIVLPEIPSKPQQSGDLNGDAQIDISDAVYLLDLMASGGTEEELLKGDMNRDGVIDISDFVFILDLMAR